ILEKNIITINSDSLQLTFNIDQEFNARPIKLHYILELANPDKLEVYENALVVKEENISVIAFDKILDEHTELVITNVDDDNVDFIGF
ncbi:MAG: hypothetical protein ABDH23_07485, partial [Endomicrobiia bacterium]